MHSSLAAIHAPLVPLLHIGVLMPFIISFGHNSAKCWVISAAPHPHSLRHSLGLITLTLIWPQSFLIIKTVLQGAEFSLYQLQPSNFPENIYLLNLRNSDY